MISDYYIRINTAIHETSNNEFSCKLYRHLPEKNHSVVVEDWWNSNCREGQFSHHDDVTYELGKCVKDRLWNYHTKLVGFGELNAQEPSEIPEIEYPSGGITKSIAVSALLVILFVFL